MKYISNKKGSSSILVILTFMMLVIFSLLVMMSSHSDYKLAQKNAVNTVDYYELTGKANSYWSDIDSLLSHVSFPDEAKIIYELEKFDPDTEINIMENSIIITKNFQNSKGKKILIKFKYNNRSKNLDLLTLKEVPKEFEYENIDFENVEVYTQ